MLVYDAAVFTHHNLNLIMVPVNPMFAEKTAREQEAICETIRLHAESAGLDGLIVPVWRSYTGRTRYLAPTQYTSVLADIEWPVVIKNLNHRLPIEATG